MWDARWGWEAGRTVRRPTHPPRAARRLVSGAGDIKLTKDGNVLLQEMVSCGWRGEGAWNPARGRPCEGLQGWGPSDCLCVGCSTVRVCGGGGGEFRLNWLLRGEPVLYPLPSGEEPPNILPDPPQHSSLPFYEVLSLFGSPGEKKKTVLYR